MLPADTEIQSSPSGLGIFSPSLLCLCTCWTSLICFDELPFSNSLPPFCPFSILVPTRVLSTTVMWLFLFGWGQDAFSRLLDNVSVMHEPSVSAITKGTYHVPFWSCLSHRDQITYIFIKNLVSETMYFSLTSKNDVLVIFSNFWWFLAILVTFYSESCCLSLTSTKYS